MADEPRVREFNFGPGNPDPGVFPAAELGAAAQRVLSRAGAELAHYPDPRGMAQLRAVRIATERTGTRPAGRLGSPGGIRIRRHHPRVQAARTATCRRAARRSG